MAVKSDTYLGIPHKWHELCAKQVTGCEPISSMQACPHDTAGGWQHMKVAYMAPWQWTHLLLDQRRTPLAAGTCAWLFVRQNTELCPADVPSDTTPAACNSGQQPNQ